MNPIQDWLAYLFARKGGDALAVKDFSLIGWLVDKFGFGKKDLKCNADLSSSELLESLQDLYIRKLAYYSAVNMISNAVSKCEFKTFSGGEETKGREFYAWNYEPNRNQNSSAFIHKMISQMYGPQYEALVIQRGGQLLVADSFCYEPKAISEIRFTDIIVDELEINTYFRQRDVLHLRPSFYNMRRVIDGLSISYAKLLSAASDDYQWKSGRHGVMNIEGLQQGSQDWQDKYSEILNNFAKPFMQNPNSVLPEFMGYKWREIESSGGRVQTTTRDIRAIVDDIFEFTYRGFGIPPVFAKGDVQGTSDATERFLTECIDPLCDLISEEITRKRYGYDGFSNGDYLVIDTTKIRHFDWITNATNVEKLISSGAKSINEVRVAGGDMPINEGWANEHFITKNYSTPGDLISLEGGEND